MRLIVLGVDLIMSERMPKQVYLVLSDFNLIRSASAAWKVGKSSLSRELG